MWKIIGHLLHWYSQWREDPRVEWLAWYLTGKGGVKEINPKFLIKESGENWISYYKSWYMPDEGSTFFAMVGKFKGKFISDTELRMLDRYYFYPTCMLSSHHNESCECPVEQRKWQFMQILEFDFRLLDPFWEGYTKAINFSKYIKVVLLPAGYDQIRGKKGIHLQLSISDSIFAGKGKPFYTVGTIPVLSHREHSIEVDYAKARSLAASWN